MIALRGITISIGCSKFLAITLPNNMKHMKECLVITSPDDAETQEVARSVHGVELFVTDAATRHGAYFNKGLCFEEAWDYWGRHGWFCIWDADILLPEHIPFDWMKPDKLYGARRKVLEDPSKYRPGMDWRKLPRFLFDGGPVGFLQIFHGEAPDIRDKRPWYDVSFSHAGGGDEYFMYLFAAQRRSVLAIDCLHLGKPSTSWFGLGEEQRGMMKRYVSHYGWFVNGRPGGRNAAVPDGWVDGEIVERVQVPGYEPSKHELKFVKEFRRRNGV
jgi:hypothetical protein